MTNDIGKAIFSKAGELGVPVGFMCMKVCVNSLLSLVYFKGKITCSQQLVSQNFNEMIFAGSEFAYIRN